MRHLILALTAAFAITLGSASATAQDASPTSATPVSSACAPPAEATNATPAATSAEATTLDAIGRLPLDHLPAQVSRGEHAERGTLSLALPKPLAAIKVTAPVTSGAAGAIGKVNRDGDDLIFTFDEITYDVGGIDLPTGRQIAAQTIRLDPSQPSTLC